MTARLLLDDGSARTLSLERWLSDVTLEEHRVLARSTPPVLDIGCGPGRHVLALAARGIPALGIDPSPEAVRIASSRGAPVLLRSVFDAVPGEGRWGCALLLDGNIGIGGDPAALLRRVGGLLRPGGRVLAEVDPPGDPSRMTMARIESGDTRSDTFPWAFVSADDIEAVARGTRFRLIDVWNRGARWFGCLDAR